MPFDGTFVAPIGDAERVLFRAADLIRWRGLAKRAREDYYGALCLHGAISVAVTGQAHGDDHPNIIAATALVQLLCDRGAAGVRAPDARGSEGGAAGPWNNMPEHTAEEVIEALEAAAMRCPVLV